MARKKLTPKKKTERAPPEKLQNTKKAKLMRMEDRMLHFNRGWKFVFLLLGVLQFVRFWSLWDEVRIWLCVGPKDLKKS